MYADDRATGVILQEKNHAKWKNALSEREKTLIVSSLFEEAVHLGYAHWNREGIQRYASIAPGFMNYFQYLWAKVKNRTRFMD
jgi:hypothetical protein